MVTYQGFVTSGLAMDANNLNALLLQADVIASRPAAQSLANISFLATDIGSLQIEDGVGGWTELGKIAYSSGGNSFLRPSGDRLMVDLVGGAPPADPNAVHIWAGSAGVVTADSLSRLIIEDNGSVRLQFLTPNTNSATILFGDPESNQAAGIQYDHANTRFNILIDASSRLFYSAGAFAFQEATKVSATGLLELETSSGNILLDPAGDVDLTPGSGDVNITGELRAQLSSNGGVVVLNTKNLSDTFNSDAELQVLVAGTSAGDPRLLMSVSGGANWYHYIDNDQSDRYAIGTQIAAGNDALRITNATPPVISFNTTQGADFDYVCGRCGRHQAELFTCCGVVQWHDDVLALRERNDQHLVKLGILELEPGWRGLKLAESFYITWSALWQLRAQIQELKSERE